MNENSDSDVEDLLNDLLSNKGDQHDGISKPESNSLRELNFNFLETDNNSKARYSTEITTTNSPQDGNFDSSDDEDRRYFENQRYSESGRQIKNILKTAESEEKHKTVTREILNGTKNCSNPKNIYDNDKSYKSSISDLNIKPKLTEVSNTSNSDIYTDPIFGLRIINPIVSSTDLKDRMNGRTAVTVSRVKSFLLNLNSEKDWVIAGIVIDKSATLKSQKGSQYCIWKISDLSPDMNAVTLFLFSGAYKALWKVTTGTVIGILNPNVLESKDEKVQAVLSIDNPQKVMILGTSKDMGTCKSTTKSGKPCTAIVNRNRCEYCIYHVRREYNRYSRRADIQSSSTGRSLGSINNEKYQNHKKPFAAITHGIPDNKFDGIPAKRNQKLYEKDCQLIALLTGTKKIMDKKENDQDCEKKDENGKFEKIDNSTSNINSLCKTEKNSNDSIILSDKSFTLEKLNEMNKKENLNKTPGYSRNKLREWSMKQGCKISPKNPKDLVQKPLNLNNLSKSNTFKSKLSLIKESQFSTKSSSSPLSVPRLGGGITSGSIELVAMTRKGMDSAKLNALKWVRDNGQFKRIDPNKTLSSKEMKEQALKRKRGDEDKEKINKKLKEDEKLTNKFKELMETKSSHINLIEQSEAKEEEKYFGKLEIKEQMEEKMMSTYKVPCKAVICLICKYTAFSSSDMCKEMKHQLKVVDAVKRFFKCGECGYRTVSLDKIPNSSCKKCASSNWQRAAMMDEKKVGMGGATLSLRGGEEKFIGSCVKDANLNLLVPE